MFTAFLRVLGMTIFSVCSPVLAGELLRWVDDSGVTHFARSLEAVPKKYRSQVKLEKSNTESVLKSASNQPPSPNGRLQDGTVPGGGKSKLHVYEVPFEAYEGDAQRVIVSVTFNGTVTVPMAIDTGAPGLIISPRVAKRLGLFENGEGMVLTAAGGIGGKAPAVRTFLDTVQVGDAKDTFIPDTITDSISESFEGLIGMVFMSKYSFKIDSVKQVVIFEEAQPDPQAPGGRHERWWRSQFKELHVLHDAWELYSSGKDLDDQERDFARRQVTEAEKLLSKLDRYAGLNSVPHPWR
ncbi:MAG: aspartyl protease family protein [Nitrospira sp.]|nr:aspartyl protease family protein [Nitrospira sp.]